MARRPPVLTGRAVVGSVVVGVGTLALLIGIAWRATSAAWFLFFPLLLGGLLGAAAVWVLWILRYF